MFGSRVVWCAPPAAYGNGLTVLVYGPSGTGKTMMVNAIAASLGKKILLVNFPMLQRSGSSHHSFGSSDEGDKVCGGGAVTLRLWSCCSCDSVVVLCAVGHPRPVQGSGDEQCRPVFR